MLHADKHALQSVLRQQALAVRQKEMDLYMSNFGTLAGQAAMLAGFAFTGFTITIDLVDVPEEGHWHHWTLRTAFFSLTACALGLLLLTVSNCALCSIFGPNLALRGPEGSMDRAVDSMKTLREQTFACFGAGLVAFHMSALLLAVLLFSRKEGAIVVTILTFFLVLFMVYAHRIWSVMRIDPSQEVHGEVKVGGVSLSRDSHGSTFMPESETTGLLNGRKTPNQTNAH
jgi:hypothetical protein